MSMLQVTDLCVNYGVIPALKGISFEVNEGEVIALIGANGAGKTTILHTVTGLVEAASGKIEFEGKDITRVPAHQIVKLGLAHVPEGRRVFPEMTVYQNLMLGAFTRNDSAEKQASLQSVYGHFPRLKDDVAAAAAPHGRAVDGPVPDPGGRDLLDHRGGVPRGDDGPSGRAEREEGAVDRGPRVRARDGQHIPFRFGVRAPRQRRDPEGLSG